MRQFFTLRFWLTLAALIGLTGVLVLVTRSSGGTATGPGDTSIGSSVPGGGSSTSSSTATGGASGATGPIDLIASVYLASPGPGFHIVDGRTTADLALTLDGTRTMVIVKGTRGENHCTHLTKVASCLVAANLLGDGVLWFSLVNGPPGNTAALPAVTELIGTASVRLANGWVVARAPVVTRSCADGSTSLADFVHLHGTDAVSVFDLAAQEVVKVICGSIAATTTTTTTVVTGSSVPATGGSNPAPSATT